MKQERKSNSAKELPDLDTRLGIVIKGLRKRIGLTQKQLAGQARVSQACISMIENAQRYKGRTRVNLRILQRVAIALGRSLSDLIKFTESVPSSNGVISELREFVKELES